MSDLLRYVAFSSNINPNFWYKLTQIKLDIDRLNEPERNIWGNYSNLATNNEAVFLEVDCTSFNSTYEHVKPYLPSHGILLNKNTIEQFKECNKCELIDEIGQRLWKIIKNGDILKNPSLLNMFIFISFADIKTYHYYYWFAFIGLYRLKVDLCEKTSISETFSEKEMITLTKLYNEISDVNQKTFFFLKRVGDDLTIETLNALIKEDNKEENLKNYEEIFFAFSDPALFADHPGWPLRNYILFLMYYCPIIHGKTINILSYRLERKPDMQIICSNSIIFKVKVPNWGENIETHVLNKPENDNSCWIGWEKNERGNFGPKLVNMSSSMDPKILANNSVDLNLKLMKWRLLPDINLEKMKRAKCLLLGSGTLGCSVARSLLAWGFRHIVFVDNGHVSYSNPVRQSLYMHEDCLNGGKPKVEAAAENVKKIFPAAETSGHKLTIPMPGHPVSDSTINQTKDYVDKLTKLISENDIIFLLTDSRESRWLPTLISAYYKKIVINSALGFDSFLVMRHGILRDENTNLQEEINPKGFKSIPGNDLGCYFCNDITAPGNSLRDRTLDQQCTVTRPGVSGIAGSLAVELAVSILQHTNGPYASAFYTLGNDGDSLERIDECILGILPHSVRGFLSSYSVVLPATQRFGKCIACSDIVLQEYAQSGIDFLIKVFNSSKYLEDLTGLTEIHQVADSTEIWEMSDTDVSDE